jgi:hypothetical protein
VRVRANVGGGGHDNYNCNGKRSIGKRAQRISARGSMAGSLPARGPVKRLRLAAAPHVVRSAAAQHFPVPNCRASFAKSRAAVCRARFGSSSK